MQRIYNIGLNMKRGKMKIENKESQSRQAERYSLSPQMGTNENNRSELRGIKPIWSNRKADILMSNVVFIILVILFFSVLLAFIVRQSSQAYIIEEQTAKKIALIIDASEKGTQVILNVEEVINRNELTGNPINIVGNMVYVKLTEKTGYRYSFFNNAQIEIIQLTGGNIKINIK